MSVNKHYQQNEDYLVQRTERIDYAPLPPGFSYAVAPPARRRKAAGIVGVVETLFRRRQPRFALTRVANLGDESGTGPVIDLYPTRQRVRVRRRRPRSRGPKLWFLLLFLLLSGIGGYWYSQRSDTDIAHSLVAPSEESQPVAAAQTDPLRALLTSDTAVIAKAIVKPARGATLGVAMNGRVRAILIAEGDLVYPGQLLVQLDDTRELVAVAQAGAQVQQAEADLLDLQAGARQEEVTAAQAVVDRAQAQLDLLLQGTTDTDPLFVAETLAAEAAVTAAEARLDQLAAGPEDEQLIAARAAMQKAEALLATATAAYDAVKWRNDIAMLLESVQLQQATIEFEAAQANYQLLLRGADVAEMRAAVAEVEQARAALARLRQPVKAGEIASARATLREAQAAYDLLRAGPRRAQLDRAEATVTAARVSLMEAEASLAETELTAPFTGTVAALAVAIGEQVAPGMAIVQLGDLSAWVLETVDLVELDVARVAPGALVAVTVDALPDALLAGRVTRVKPLGEDKFGDMTYTVYIDLASYIDLDGRNLPLAWNMTATVYISTP